MDRREFITKSCTACASATVLISLLSSCQATRYVSGKLNNDGLLVPLSEFKTQQRGKDTYHSFIVVRNEALQYPVCVFRLNESEYSALWMQCSHQGSELQASGSFLQCPAHGSEFNNKGQVTSGPADKDLRSFPVTINKDELFIDLRKP